MIRPDLLSYVLISSSNGMHLWSSSIRIVLPLFPNFTSLLSNLSPSSLPALFTLKKDRRNLSSLRRENHHRRKKRRAHLGEEGGRKVPLPDLVWG